MTEEYIGKATQDKEYGIDIQLQSNHTEFIVVSSIDEKGTNLNDVRIETNRMDPGVNRSSEPVFLENGTTSPTSLAKLEKPSLSPDRERIETHSPKPTPPPIEIIRIPVKPVKPAVHSIDGEEPTYFSAFPASYRSYVRHFNYQNQTTTRHYLFVVNFHESYYQPVGFLQSSFFPKFRGLFHNDFDVVFTGPTADRWRRVIRNTLFQHGHYSYYSLTHIYELLCASRNCSYDGYLLLNDDSFVDPIYLSHVNLSRSFSEPSSPMNPKDPKDRWQWYSKRNVANVRFDEAYREAIQELQTVQEVKRCHLEQRVNQRKGMGDITYVAGKDITLFNSMSTVMKKHFVFLEMALPTINWCLSDVAITDCNHLYMRNIEMCVHIHPVKYRQPGMQEYAMNRLDRVNMWEKPRKEW